MFTHWIPRTVAVALATAVLFACSAPNTVDRRVDPNRPNVLRVGNGTEPEGLDPHFITGVPEHHILTALFEGLVRADPTTLDPTPGVAETWEMSDDGLVYTFHLRSDAKWSNGEPVTSQDFMYAWRRILTPSLASEYSYMLWPMKNAEAYNMGKITDFAEVGCDAPDARTVIVTLENPAPYFLSLQIHYSWFPVHQETIEKYGAMDDRKAMWTRPGNMVSNGPFFLAKWEPNNVIRVDKNPKYWNAANVSLEAVEFYPVQLEQTEDRMFRAGELDVTENVAVSKVSVYREKRPDLIRTDDWLGNYFYRINTTREAFKDARVRRALAMAIDRDSICTNILHAGEKPADAFTPPDMRGYVSPTKIVYDPETAKALMAEAGYPDGKGFPTIELLYNTQEKHKIIAEAVQRMLKETLHIDVQLVNQDWKVYLDNTSNAKMNYDIARAGWIADIMDPINFLECFTTDNGNNRTGYSSPEYDALIAQTRLTNDVEERNRLFGEAETILIHDMPLLPIYYYTRPFLIAPEVKNFPHNRLAYYPYDVVSIDTSGN